VELTLAGGSIAEIERSVAAARAAGCARVIVDVDGLAEAELPRVAAAGVDAVHVTVFAADPAAHDLHAAEGGFRRTIALLRAARAMKVRAVVTTPLGRSNARVLAALPGLLADLAVVGWRIMVPAVDGAWREQFDSRVPRLALAIPYALQAIVTAERAGVEAGIAGAPLCLLGPLRGRALPERARAFAAECERCPARGECSGVDPAYLQRFAGDELSPRALRAAEGRPIGQALRDMFSGTECAPAEAV
jgi:hypothetical protein